MARAEPISAGHVPIEACERFVATTRDPVVFFLDPEGRVASWTEGAAELLKHAAEEIVGRSLSAFYRPMDIADRRPQFDLRVAATRGWHTDEGWRVRGDGTTFWASCAITALHADDGTLLGFAKVMRDHTARKHAEDALRQSEERFRLLSQSVRDYAIFLLDTHGHVASWNEGARHLKGYEAEEILGEHFSQFYTDEDRARSHPEHELQIALREGSYHEEGWRLRKDGSRFWASVTITTLRDPSGKHVGFAKVTRDLTTRKQAEEELRERARSYAEINRELDAFSHTVAHDLRSPIRAIEHLSVVLLEEEGARLSPEGRDTLEALHRTSLNMARLVQGLLDLSTATAGGIHRADVDVTKLARDVAAELTRGSERSIVVRVQDGLRVRADPNLLRVALANLLGNAVKFTRDVERAEIEVGESLTPRGRALYVRDNGVGFDPARAQQIFQPFARFHSHAQFEGTGIGLATVRRILERHGGTIWADSKPGQGATFWLTFGEEAS